MFFTHIIRNILINFMKTIFYLCMLLQIDECDKHSADWVKLKTK